MDAPMRDPRVLDNHLDLTEKRVYGVGNWSQFNGLGESGVKEGVLLPTLLRRVCSNTLYFL